MPPPPAGPMAAARYAASSPFAPSLPPHPIDLRLDANEGAPPPLDSSSIIQSPGIGEMARRYPSAGALEADLAGRLGVAPSCVIVTAGGDEAIDRACRVFLDPGRELVAPVPTFEMIPRYAAHAGATLVTTPWIEGDYPLAAVLERLTPRTGMVAVVSPNNPTGAIATRGDLERLSAAAPHALLLVDQAYTEFADEDLTPTALGLHNALVVRTFSKAFGLAGLRVGYAAGPERIIRTLRAAAGPFPTSGLSLALARAALGSAGGWMPVRIARVRQERRDLARVLRECGALAGESQGNFVLGRFAESEAVWEALARQGIGVRRVGPAQGFAGGLRITCPCDGTAFERLCGAIRAATQGAPP